MNDVENVIVKMTFDNKEFEKGVKETVKTLQNLEKLLGMDDASEGLDKVSDAAGHTSDAMDELSDSVSNTKSSFSALEVVAYTTLSTLTVAALKAGTKIGSAIWNPIVSGGVRRARNIENAKFQIEGLGHSWEELYEDINFGVKGTAYGLDEAAKIAGQLLASGMEAGDGMKATLLGISGVAAMTNSTYEDIGYIYTTIKANGRLMTEQIRQFSSRGLNIAAKLAEALKVSEQEVYNLVSKGKVSFEEFSKAMYDAFGTQAKKANDTFQGATSNMRAALARIGEMFATPIFESLRQAAVALTPVIDDVSRQLKPVAKWMTTILNIQNNWLSSLNDSKEVSRSLMSIVIVIFSYLRPMVAALQEVGILTSRISTDNSLSDWILNLQLWGEKIYAAKEMWVTLFGTLKTGAEIIKGVFRIVKPFLDFAIQVVGRLMGITGETAWIVNHLHQPVQNLIAAASKFVALRIEKVLAGILRIIDSISWKDILKFLKLIPAAIGVILMVAKTAIEYLVKGITWIISNLGAIGYAFMVFKSQVQQALAVVRDFVSEVLHIRIPPISLHFDTSTARAGVTSMLDYVGNKIKAISNITSPVLSSTTGVALDTLSTNFRTPTESKNRANGGKPSTASKRGAGSDEKRPSSDIYDADEKVIETTQDLSNATEKLNDTFTDSKSKITGVVESLNKIAPAIKNVGTLFNGFTIKVKESVDSVGSDIGIKDSNKKQTLVQIFIGRLKERFMTIKLAVVDFLETTRDNILELISKINPVKAALAVLGTLAVVVIAQALRIIFAIVDLVVAIPKALTSMFTLLDGMGAAMQAEKYKSIAILVGSIAGFVAALALIAKFCDLNQLQQVIDILFSYALKLLKAVGGIIMIVAVMNSLYSVAYILSKITGGVLVTPIGNLAKILPAIGATLVMVSASMWFLVNYFDEDQFMTGLKRIGIIAGLLTAFIFFMSLFMNAFKAYDSSTTAFTLGVGKIAKKNNIAPKFERTMQSVSTTIVSMTLSLMLYTGYAIYALEKLAAIDEADLKKGIIAFGALTGIITVAIAIMQLSANNLKQTVSKYDADITKVTKETLTISAMVNSVMILVLGVSAALAGLSFLPEDGLVTAAKVLGIAVASIAFMLTAIGIAVNKMKEVTYDRYISILTGLQPFMLSAAALIISIGGALAALAFLPVTGIIKGGVTLVTVIGALVGMMIIISKTVQGNAKKLGSSLDPRTLVSTMKEVSIAFTAIIPLIITTAAVLALLSAIPAITESGGGLMSAVIGLLGVMAGITLVVMSMGELAKHIKGSETGFKQVAITFVALVASMSLMIGAIALLTHIGISGAAFAGVFAAMALMAGMLLVVSGIAADAHSATDILLVAAAFDILCGGLLIISSSIALLSNFGGDLGPAMDALLTMFSLMGLIGVLTITLLRGVLNARTILYASLLFASMSALVLTMGTTVGSILVVLDRIESNNINPNLNTFTMMADILLAFAGFILVVGAIAALVGNVPGVATGLLSISAYMTSIAIFAVSIAAALRLVDGVDWTFISRMLDAITQGVAFIKSHIETLLVITAGLAVMAITLQQIGNSIATVVAALGVAVLAILGLALMIPKFVENLGSVIDSIQAVNEKIESAGGFEFGGTLMNNLTGLLNIVLALSAIGLLMVGAGVGIGVGGAAMMGGMYGFMKAIELIVQFREESNRMAWWGDTLDSIANLGLCVVALLVVGTLMTLTGALMGVGGAAMLLGMLAFLGTISVLDIVIEKVNGLPDLVNALIAFESLIKIVAIMGVMSGIALLIGAPIILGSILLTTGLGLAILMVMAMGTLIEKLNTANLKMGPLLTLLGCVGLLALIGVAEVIAGSVMAIGGAAFLIGTILLGIVVDKLVDITKVVSKSKSFKASVVLGLGLTIAAFILVGGAALLAGGSLLIGGLALLSGTIIFGLALNALIEMLTSISDTSSSFMSTIQDLFLTNWAELGGYLIEGLVEGILNCLTTDSILGNAISATVSFIAGVWSDLTETHSPSEMFARFGDWLMQGLGNGVQRGWSWVQEKLGGVAGNIQDWAENGGITDIMESLGINSGYAFGNGLTDSMKSVWLQFSEQYGTQLARIQQSLAGKKETLRQLQASWDYIMRTYFPDETQQETIRNGNYGLGIKKYNVGYGHQQMTLQELAQAISKLTGEVNSLAASEGEYTKTLQDLEERRQLMGDTSFTYPDFPTAGGGSMPTPNWETSDMASTIAGASGAGSGINDISRMGNGNTVNSNNTYNFVQNNYSPEPLERTELYRQTRAQMNDFVGVLGM